jgi:nitroreductase
MIKDLILKNRSYRRFHENVKIPKELLLEWIDLARQSPSGKNMQPLKYVLSCEPETNNKIFPNLSWAGYLKDWQGPQEGERPSAYIIMLLDTQIRKEIDCDHGIAAQSILLGAVESGFGGCIVHNVNRTSVSAALKIPERYKILMCIALGKPNEKVILENLGGNGDIKYWRDAESAHHVPKRPLEEIILDFGN